MNRRVASADVRPHKVTRRVLLSSAILAACMPLAPAVRPTQPALAQQEMAQFWREPLALATADLFYGPWGAEHAPAPEATYALVKVKAHGASPGLTARDSRGTEWSVKQGVEGPVEVTLSRVLSAIGYHQPPVYFMHSFVLDRGGATGRVSGGRFRAEEPWLDEKGEWSWQQNPFVGTKPYQGLLVALLMFNSSDLKNSNNSVYDLPSPREGATRWFVVRDIGLALGETARLDPKRGDPDLFEQLPFIRAVHDGYVEFSYHGWHQELIRGRITPSDLRWACDFLGRLSDQQWADAFRAGGHDPTVADRFIRRIKAKIDEGHLVGRQ